MAQYTLPNNGDSVWLGTENSYYEYLASEARVGMEDQIKLQREARMGMDDDDEDENDPYLLSKAGTVGVINIRGPLKSEAAFYDRWFGMASYPAIRQALVSAYQDEGIERIILLINSSGGHVNGVSDVADLILKIKQDKPVIAYTTGDMCSAAYWIGCSADKVFASPISTVGSIGAVITHMDRTKQLEEMGIKATVIRSGAYKMLGGPFETLSETAKQEIQNMVDATEKVFVSHVAKMRGRTEDYIRQGPGQGKVFIGQASVDMGLVDGIASIDSVIVDAISGKFDKANEQRENVYRFGISMEGTDMTPEEKAALAAAMAAQGLPVQASADAGEDGGEQAAIEAQAQAEAQAQEGEQTGGEEGAGTQASGEAAEGAGNLDAFMVLSNQLNDKTAALAVATSELDKTKAELADLREAADGLSKLVAQSLSNMQVAMGASAVDYSGLDAKALLTEHDKVKDTFIQRFKAGGVAATTAEAEAARQTRVLSSTEAAAHAATRLA